MSLQLAFDLIATFLLAAGLLFYYGNWYHHHLSTTLPVLIAWYFSFIIVVVLPLDISTTTYSNCLLQNNATTNSTNCTPPAQYIPPATLQNLWRVVYWSSQFLTWLILPLTQSYSMSGEFTVKNKLKSALLDNAMYYGLYLFICSILLIYLATRPDLELDFQKLKAIASSASNSFGLFLLVFMLGFGLVSVPRSVYNASNRNFLMNRNYFKVAKLSQERNSAEEAVEDFIEVVLTSNAVDKKRLETIENLIPVELKERVRRRNRLESSELLDEKTLVKLHKNVKKSLQNYHRVENQWEDQISYGIGLEDTEKFVKGRTGQQKFQYYYTIAKPYFLKALALVLAIFSLIVIWSEATFFNKSPVLSFFAAVLHSVGENYFAIEVIGTMTTCYMAVCAFYTIFKIRVFNFYYLAGRHHTDEYSLIFSGMLLSRITPPLSLNVISLYHLDSHIIQNQSQETSYTRIMGHMDVLSLIADGFNIYFPMGILLIAILTWFKVGSRLLSLVGISQFIEDEEDEDSVEMIAEGRQLVGRERRRRGQQQGTPRPPQETQNIQNPVPRPLTSQSESSSRHYSSIQPPRDLFNDV